jgi:DNA-directed RNA polymerase specialized sigma24 family protein
VAAQKRKPAELTIGSFERLLAFLDDDPDRAAERYEKIREKLCRLFEWRGCIPGVDYADETIDRVAKRLEEGLEEKPKDPYLYFHGVALNVIRERWRKAAPEPQSLEAVRQVPSVNPFEIDRARESSDRIERRLGCLQDCLDRLTPASRELITAYHLGGSGVNIARRQSLADRLNIPAAALRLRVFRIRRQLERCLGACPGERNLLEKPTLNR